MKTEALAIAADSDVVLVRKAVRLAAIEVRLSLVDQTKLVTAASEIARNTFVYGGGGTCTVEVVTDGGRVGVRLTFEDQGPGISDIALALTEGYTSGGGLGLGLCGAKRLVHEFQIESDPGQGTRIVLVRWK